MNKWFDFKNEAENSADIYFYGDIVSDEWGKWTDDDCCPKDVADALKECEGKDLNIYINSGGGSVFGGMAIYNQLMRHNGKKTVHVDGIAGSIASVIAMAGDEIVMPGNAYLMIHKPWTSAWGENADGLRKIADTLDVLENGILNVYASRLADGVSIETVKQLVGDETWLTGEQAKDYFNIRVEKPVEAVNCVSDCFKNYMHTPKCLTQKDEHKAKEQPEREPKNKSNQELERLQIALDLLNV